MNRIDAFFTMFSLLLVWICCVFLLPSKVMMFVYAGIAAWAVGVFIANVPRRLAKETERDFLEAMWKVADDQQAVLNQMLITTKELLALSKSKQAIIDRLMFEYCPDEMTPEQIANYEAHVGQISKEQEEEIERALNPESGQYNKMMAEVEQLMKLDPAPDSEEGKRLLALTAQIEGYEKLHFPFMEVKH